MKNKNKLLSLLVVTGATTMVMSSENVHANNLLNQEKILESATKNVTEKKEEANLNAKAKNSLSQNKLTSSLGGTMQKVQEKQDKLDLAVKPPVPVKSSVKSEQTNAKKAEKKTSKVDSLIASGNKLKGIPYVWGGTTTKGFDCSGFTQYIFNQNGITLPRTSAEQAQVGKTISSKSSLQAGDLVFFATGGSKSKVTHVGMYIGDNKFIHASTSKGISVASINDPYYWGNKFLHGKRINGVN